MPRFEGLEPSPAAAPPVVAAPPEEPPSRYAPIVPAFSRQDREGGVAPHPGSPAAEPGTGSGRERGQGITSFFQVEAHGRSVVYVIDRSASMGPSGGLAAAKSELLTSLEQLPPEARFQVIAYNRTAAPLPINGQTGLLRASAENKRQVALLVEGLDAEGGTEHLPALKHALALQPDVIYLLTDADDFHSDQVRIITGLNHGRTVIHAIVLTTERQQQDEQSLARLAQANSGEYRVVSLASP
jgi:Ca-activated chloride channel family protein